MAYRLMVVAGENEALRAIVGQLGDDFQVTHFESADEALWDIRDDPPEALIADLDLPGMSGMDLAEIMPNFELRTRLLLWSRGENAEARQQAGELGVYHFFSGNVASDKVTATIREAVSTLPEPEPEPESEPAPEPAARVREEIKPARVVLPSRDETAAAEPARRSQKDMTPARVVLPSAAERNQAARSATRPAAKAEAKPAAKAEAKPAEIGSRRRQGTLVVTAENLNPIRKIMSSLMQDLGAQNILLTDRAGMVLVEVGNNDGLPMIIVLPLLSTSFSSAGEIARQMRDSADSTSVYIHDGVNYDLYGFDVAQRFLLVLVFNKKVASSKIGAVWVNAKRAVRELREALG